MNDRRDEALLELLIGLSLATVIAVFCVFVFAGCATSTQRLTTADGDQYARRGISVFSKQSAEGRANLVAYPNGSGLEFQVGDESEQDSTGLVPLLEAFLRAYLSSGPTPSPFGGGPSPSGASLPPAGFLQQFESRLTELDSIAAQIRSLYGSGSAQRPKSAVGPVQP